MPARRSDKNPAASLARRTAHRKLLHAPRHRPRPPHTNADADVIARVAGRASRSADRLAEDEQPGSRSATARPAPSRRSADSDHTAAGPRPPLPRGSRWTHHHPVWAYAASPMLIG